MRKNKRYSVLASFTIIRERFFSVCNRNVSLGMLYSHPTSIWMYCSMSYREVHHEKNKLLVIGGSDAGISASLRARELSPDTEVTMILADRYPNFSICGLPFYLSGEISDWKTLAHRTIGEIEEKGIQLCPDHRVTAIHPGSETRVGQRRGRPQQDLCLR